MCYLVLIHITIFIHLFVNIKLSLASLSLNFIFCRHCFTLNSLASCFCNIIMCLLIKFVFVVAVVVNVPCFCVFLRYRNENTPRHWNGMPLIWSFYICHYQFSKLMATFMMYADMFISPFLATSKNPSCFVFSLTVDNL